jgi:hypothetical protein
MMKGLNFFLLSLFPLLASAHHGDAGRFNDDITELHGTVVALQLTNPHSVVLINVTAEDGSLQTWQVELEAPQRLARDFGWGRDTLLPGTDVIVTGRQIKSGAPQINLTEESRILIQEGCVEVYHSRDLQPLEANAQCEF